LPPNTKKQEKNNSKPKHSLFISSDLASVSPNFMVAKLTYVEAKGMSVSFIITTMAQSPKAASNGHG